MANLLRCLALLTSLSLVASALYAATPLAPENHRITVRVMDPNVTSVGQWRVLAETDYEPLVQGSPNTTETTKSRDNCAPQAPYTILPSFKRCERTRNRLVTRPLPAAQMRAVDAHTLNLDFAPVIEDGGGTFVMKEMALRYKPCAEGCEVKYVFVRLTCWAEDLERGDVLAGNLLLSYSRGAKANPAAAQCGLKLGDETTWANRDMVMKYVRGHFGDDQQLFSSDMLNIFSAIPTRDHGWQWNAARVDDNVYTRCPLPENQTFLRHELLATLPVSPGWPYRNEVAVEVTRKPDGEVCQVALSGTGDEQNLRFTYGYAKGQLVIVSTYGAPDDSKREWRWANNEPWEYMLRERPASVYGHDAVSYWHKDAAKQWPQQMDFSPDLKEFAALNGLAQEMVERFGK